MGVVAGEIILEGRDLLALDEEGMRAVRGDRIGMVFQEPMTSLNPVMTIGAQIGEGLAFHRQMNRADARARALELLDQVGFPGARARLDDYPHQLSGGMRQRVMIAMALACDPALLLADEPTTALDVTIQAQILQLLRRLQQERRMGIVLITHDLGVVAEMADEIAIMYAGRIIERGSVAAIFEDPQHPYTIGLLGSIARLDIAQDRLDTIPGQVPGPSARFRGCRFSDRCPFADAECHAAEPALATAADGHAVACWKAPF
jgi:oligopeptide/dipeptide ABC transporter ATP-binding protein